jgi:hypothetical protein
VHRVIRVEQQPAERALSLDAEKGIEQIQVVAFLASYEACMATLRAR